MNQPPEDWPDSDPSKITVLVAQRDEFKRRSLQCRQALEDARTAFETGNRTELARILKAHTIPRKLPTMPCFRCRKETQGILYEAQGITLASCADCVETDAFKISLDILTKGALRELEKKTAMMSPGNPRDRSKT